MTCRVNLHNCLECGSLTGRLSLICDGCEVEHGYSPYATGTTPTEPAPAVTSEDIDDDEWE